MALIPLIKWAGGKRSELPVLTPLFPSSCTRVIEPFAGGAAVAFALDPPQAVLNDFSSQLIAFYRTLQQPSSRAQFGTCLAKVQQIRQRLHDRVERMTPNEINRLFAPLSGSNPGTEQRAQAWGQNEALKWFAGLPQELVQTLTQDVLSQIQSKTQQRIHALESTRGKVFGAEERRKHLETALMAGVYTTLRRVYNHQEPLTSQLQKDNSAWVVVAWYVVRALCYSGMFRYAKNGAFNVPYGGIGYNSRDFDQTWAYMNSPEVASFLQRTTFMQGDFEHVFDQVAFQSGDFVFVDPPYDTTFSQYNKEEDFTQQDQIRLRDRLVALQTPWMLVIKNTPFVLNLYDTPKASLHHAVFGKSYQLNFRNRGDRGVEHLIVTNYPLPASSDVLRIDPKTHFSSPPAATSSEESRKGF